ncbi:MAG: hypothetical protein AAFR73_05955 [Pseudomonadota bacterium]
MACAAKREGDGLERVLAAFGHHAVQIEGCWWPKPATTPGWSAVRRRTQIVATPLLQLTMNRIREDAHRF